MRIFGIGSSPKQSNEPKALPSKVFKKYRQHHETGQQISLQLLAGGDISGTIVEWDSDSIMVNANGNTEIFQATEISKIVLHGTNPDKSSVSSPDGYERQANSPSPESDGKEAATSPDRSPDEDDIDESIETKAHEALLSAWYPDRNYGFLWDNKKKKTLFFRRYNILDARVLTSLEEGGIRQRVYYSVLKTSGKSGKYDLVQIEELISESGQKQGVTTEPSSASLPSGNSLYARAKRAEFNGQLDVAESLYLHLVANKADPKYYTAIMDLASLQNRFDSNKAVETLKSHREDFPEERKLVVDRATVQYLYRAQRYLEAAELLKATMEVMERNHEMDESTRKHYTLQLNQCYENANRAELIQHIEGDATPTSDGDPITDLLFIPEQLLINNSEGFSYLLHLVTNADFSETKVGINSFDDLPDSIPELMELLSTVEEKRKILMAPADRSNFTKKQFAVYHELCRLYQLLLAAISLLLYVKGKRTAKTKNAIRQSWKRYFTEDVQCLLFEESESNFSRLFSSFGWLCRLQHPGASWPQRVSRLLFMAFNQVESESIIQFASERPQVESLTGFSELGSDCSRLSPAGFAHLLDRYDLLSYVPDLEDEFGKREKSEAVLADSYSARRETVLGIVPRIKTALFISGQNIDLLKETVSTFSETIEEDREVSQQADILLGLAQEYVAEVDALKKKELLDTFKTTYESALDRYVNVKPSLYSTEILFPVLGACLDALSSDMDRLAALPVSLEIKHAESSEYPIENGEIQLKLLLRSCSLESPPILKVATSADSEHGDEEDVDYFDGPLVGGGSPHEISLSVPISEDVRRDKAGTVNLVVKYQTILEQAKQVILEVPFTIVGENAFTALPNPYANWATGTAMIGEFFVGRKPLLDEIKHVFESGNGGQCYVLYGQARSGKTSVKDNLILTIDRSVYLVVDLKENMDTVFRNASEKDPFIFIEKQFRRIAFSYCQGIDEIPEYLPQERIGLICENAQNDGRKVLVAMDEFTRLYEEACMSKQSELRVRAFLRGIKGLLGARAFQMIIIGQESMVQFRDAFPNEFAVTKFKRLSYLSKDDARTLAEKPILHNGASRYREHAFDRLFELTAGYPYYTHIFCDRLIQYLNENRLPIIEEAQINAIEKNLCSGESQLSRADFSSFTELYLPQIPKESIAGFYYAVANGSKETGWCALEQIRPLPDGSDLSRILAERGILEQIDDKIRIRMGLFASWLRANPDALP